jgi:hypothetical protein
MKNTKSQATQFHAEQPLRVQKAKLGNGTGSNRRGVVRHLINNDHVKTVEEP